MRIGRSAERKFRKIFFEVAIFDGAIPLIDEGVFFLIHVESDDIESSFLRAHGEWQSDISQTDNADDSVCSLAFFHKCP